MCIIINKEKNISLPSKELLKKCWHLNPNGGGYMYNYENKVVIHKGFTNFEEFYSHLLETNKQYNLVDKNLIIHFRIATSGLVDKGNCHPFPITDSTDILRSTDIVCGMAVAHNGVIHEYNHQKSLLNDTQLFIKEIIFNIISNAKYDFYKTNCFKKIIEKMTDGSRMIFLNGEGIAIKTGHWYKENGLFFSNLLFKKSKVKHVKRVENELKYLDDFYNKDDEYYLDDDKIEEYDFNLFLDTLTSLNDFESVYSIDFFEEYNGKDGNFYLDEDEKIIYELIDNHTLCSLGDYMTKEDYYHIF